MSKTLISLGENLRKRRYVSDGHAQT
jgi:hypothetical protein